MPLANTSIIVPVGPGELAWRSLLDDLQKNQVGQEIIFAAVESPPGDWATLARDAHPMIRWLETTPGRAAQMNAGVEQAAGDYYWFVHADSRLDRSVVEAFSQTIGQTPNTLYYFDLSFDDDGPAWTRLNAWGANLRSRWLGLPFGDQAFCVSRSTYAQLGPFNVDVPYGEDHLWVWTARRCGIALRRVKASIRTSGRKYAARGWFATTVLHAWRTVRQAVSELMKDAL